MLNARKTKPAAKSILSQADQAQDLAERSLVDGLQKENDRLHCLAHRVTDQQDKDLAEIAVQLHDGAGQSLTALRLNLALLQENSGANETCQDQIQQSIQLVEATMEELRGVVHHLRPPALTAEGIQQALRDFCARTTRQTGIPVVFQGLDDVQLPAYLQVILFRVAQTYINELSALALAAFIQVRLDQDAEETRLEIDVAPLGRPGNLPPSVDTIGSSPQISTLRDQVEVLGGRMSAGRIRENLRVQFFLPTAEAL